MMDLSHKLDYKTMEWIAKLDILAMGSMIRFQLQNVRRVSNHTEMVTVLNHRYWYSEKHAATRTEAQ